MTADSIARKWHDQLLRTDQVDHERAEAAVSTAYRAAGTAEPRHFLWCASPLEAVWAVLVLAGRSGSYSRAVYEDVERWKAGGAKLAEARARVARHLGIAEEEVEGYFGKPFYAADGSNRLTKRLADDSLNVWMARAGAGEDYLAADRGGPFKSLHDLEESLHFEGTKGGKASLVREGLETAGARHVAALGARSAHHRLYGHLAYIEVARDEALAAEGRFEPTELQRAMWAAYEACGMWWPCQNGTVFSERPVRATKAGERVAMQWTDGFVVGYTIREKHFTDGSAVPESPPSSAVADASVLLRPLPSDHDSRIPNLRATAPLPLFERYLAGEHEQVWADLVSLGEAVRTDAHAADALAVAYETMHRVEQNVRTLVSRLEGLGYSFVTPGRAGSFFGLRKPAAHRPWTPPVEGTWDRILELESAAGGPLPFSLRTFYEVVGEVNLLGRHPQIAPDGSDPAPDPLMVAGVEDAIASIDAWEGEERMIAISPDAVHKAGLSGGDPYHVIVPAPVADAPLEGEPHELTFVEYLRLAFRWGGFPGWEGAKRAPRDLERLSEGLLPF